MDRLTHLSMFIYPLPAKASNPITHDAPNCEAFFSGTKPFLPVLMVMTGTVSFDSPPGLRRFSCWKQSARGKLHSNLGGNQNFTARQDLTLQSDSMLGYGLLSSRLYPIRLSEITWCTVPPIRS
eukprot:5503393-Pyramimonas_sp.AAC.1